mmetsp:Transcript_54246/g.79521  ORF Transcript_54246/g.79521 Transcript_54246/m.79521 type:complete len:649 (+) Transcript_54246:9-1955(+)
MSTGIGVVLQAAPGGQEMVVARIVDGGAAQKINQIFAGDIISRINGISVFGWALDKVKEKMQGPENSKVQIGVRRKGEELLVSMTRSRPQPQALADKLKAASGLGGGGGVMSAADAVGVLTNKPKKAANATKPVNADPHPSLEALKKQLEDRVEDIVHLKAANTQLLVTASKGERALKEAAKIQEQEKITARKSEQQAQSIQDLEGEISELRNQSGGLTTEASHLQQRCNQLQEEQINLRQQVQQEQKHAAETGNKLQQITAELQQEKLNHQKDLQMQVNQQQMTNAQEQQMKTQQYSELSSKMTTQTMQLQQDMQQRLQQMQVQQQQQQEFATQQYNELHQHLNAQIEAVTRSRDKMKREYTQVHSAYQDEVNRAKENKTDVARAHERISLMEEREVKLVEIIKQSRKDLFVQQEACRVQRDHIDTADRTVTQQNAQLVAAGEQQHDMSQRLTQLEQLLQTANYELKLSKERLEQNQYWTTLNQTSKLNSLVSSQANSRGGSQSLAKNFMYSSMPMAPANMTSAQGSLYNSSSGLQNAPVIAGMPVFNAPYQFATSARPFQQQNILAPSFNGSGSHLPRPPAFLQHVQTQHKTQSTLPDASAMLQQQYQNRMNMPIDDFNLSSKQMMEQVAALKHAQFKPPQQPQQQ